MVLLSHNTRSPASRTNFTGSRSYLLRLLEWESEKERRRTREEKDDRGGRENTCLFHLGS